LEERPEGGGAFDAAVGPDPAKVYERQSGGSVAQGSPHPLRGEGQVDVPDAEV
jgi:hypothetical protein